MSTFALALKKEIMRLARREVKMLVVPLRGLVRKQRAAIATLKRGIACVTTAIEAAKTSKDQPGATVSDKEVKKSRFSPLLLKKLRIKKSLSMAKLARLIDSSPMTVKMWESGKFRPSAKYRKALVAVRKLSKREIKKLLTAKAGK